MFSKYKIHQFNWNYISIFVLFHLQLCKSIAITSMSNIKVNLSISCVEILAKKCNYSNKNFKV